MSKGEKGVWTFKVFTGILSVSRCRKFSFRRGTFSVSKVPCIEKIYASEGDVNLFCRDIVCLTVPKIFLSEFAVLCFRNFPVAKKFVDKREGYQDFPFEHFCITVPKTLIGDLLVFHKFRVSKTNYSSVGYVSSFCPDFCCPTQPKIFLGDSFCAVFHKLYGCEKDYE